MDTSSSKMMSVFTQLTDIYNEMEQLRIENRILKDKLTRLENTPPSEHSTDQIKIDSVNLTNMDLINETDFIKSPCLSLDSDEETIDNLDNYYVDPPTSPKESDIKPDDTPLPSSLKPLPSEEEEQKLFSECVTNGKCGCEGNTFQTGKRRNGGRPLDLLAFKVHYKKSKHHQLWYATKLHAES